MALVFQRRLAIPLWAVAFFAVALTAPPTATLFLMPPTTVFAIAAVGIAAIVFLMPRSIPWLRTSRALDRVLPSGHRDQASAAIAMTAGTGVRTLAEPNGSAADDALDLFRMDDDGGWQMPRRRPNAAPAGACV
jgi:hypothetical protein